MGIDLYGLDLSEYGAPGYELNIRLDGSGHRSGRVDPHLNADLMRGEEVLRGRQFRDLISEQLPGFNGMQEGC